MTEAGWTRERKLVEELSTFIEAVSGRKLRFSSIANLKTGETEDPQDRIAAWLKRHLDADRQQGRVEGELLGLQQGLLIAHIFEQGTAAQVIEGIKARIDELAQAAQDEKGVGDGKTR